MGLLDHNQHHHHSDPEQWEQLKVCISKIDICWVSKDGGYHNWQGEASHQQASPSLAKCKCCAVHEIPTMVSSQPCPSDTRSGGIDAGAIMQNACKCPNFDHNAFLQLWRIFHPLLSTDRSCGSRLQSEILDLQVWSGPLVKAHSMRGLRVTTRSL